MDRPWWDDTDSVIKWPRALVCRRRPWERAEDWECSECSAELLKVLMPSEHPDFPNGVWTWVCPSCEYAPAPLPDPRHPPEVHTVCNHCGQGWIWTHPELPRRGDRSLCPCGGERLSRAEREADARQPQSWREEFR